MEKAKVLKLQVSDSYYFTANAEVEVKSQNFTLRVEYVDNKVQIEKSKEFELAENLLGEIDLSELETMYISQMEIVKQEKEEKERIAAKEKYDKLWIHHIHTEDLPEGVEIQKTTFEEYFNNLYARDLVKIQYKGYTIGIEYGDVSTSRIQKMMRYSFNDLNYKKRNYSTFKAAVKKIMELVDEDIEKKERLKKQQKEKANREQKEEQELKQFEINGWVLKKDSKWNQYGRYTYTVFMLEKPQQSISISKYKDTYSLGQFKQLTKEQVINILNLI